MHWATFTLTDEDTIEPKERLKKAVNENGSIDFKSVSPGDVIYLK